MPKIILKRSGKVIPVSEEGLAKILANPEMKDLYKYPKPAPPAEEPEEVTKLKNSRKGKHASKQQPTEADVSGLVQGDQQDDQSGKDGETPSASGEVHAEA